MKCVAVLAVALGVTAPLASAGDAPSTQVRDLRVVQEVDDIAYLVDARSLMQLDGAYVFAAVSAVRVREPPTELGEIAYVVDCAGTPKVAPVAFSFPDGGQGAQRKPGINVYHIGKFNPAELEFRASLILDGTRSAAEFACRAVKEPLNAGRIADDVAENAGIRDLKSVTCSLARGSTSRAFELKFSESEHVVKMNRIWRSSGAVTPDKISFSSPGAIWQIDRRSGNASMTKPSGELLASGQCELAPVTKKF